MCRIKILNLEHSSHRLPSVFGQPGAQTQFSGNDYFIDKPVAFSQWYWKASLSAAPTMKRELKERPDT